MSADCFPSAEEAAIAKVDNADTDQATTGNETNRVRTPMQRMDMDYVYVLCAGPKWQQMNMDYVYVLCVVSVLLLLF